MKGAKGGEAHEFGTCLNSSFPILITSWTLRGLSCTSVKRFEWETCLHCNKKGKSAEAAQYHTVDKCHCKILFEGDAAMV